MKNPCVVESILTLCPGLIESELSPLVSPLPSIAISNSFNFMKHNLGKKHNNLQYTGECNTACTLSTSSSHAFTCLYFYISTHVSHEATQRLATVQGIPAIETRSN